MKNKVLTPLIFLISTCSYSQWAHAEPQSISVADFSKDSAKVVSLRKGFSVMQARNGADSMSADYRTSFAYWANTHGYFGTGKYATNLQKYIDRRMLECLQTMTKAQCDTYYKHMQNTPVPNDGVTDDIWGTCQHGNLNFLPWHRLYLHFFERTLRKATGDSNFALPYWNYYDNYQPAKQGIGLPSIVRKTTSNSLYDRWRTLGLNKNTALMDPNAASAVAAFQFNDFTNFSNTLQGQPHGAMHCAVGSGCTAPDIGFVPIAGLDPVFYMHHKNIDRLWQCWLTKQSGGKPIDLAWAKANLGMPDSWYDISYQFMDENGKAVSMTIADVFDPSKIQVNYDNLVNCDATVTKKSALMATGATAAQEVAQLKAHAPMRTTQAVSLGSKAVTVNLSAENTTASDAVMMESKTSGTAQTYLSLNQVAIQGSPALTYSIYLVNKKAPKKSSYVATISLFGAGAHHHEHGGDANQLGNLVYNISQNLSEIGVTDANQASVQFQPTSLMLKNTVQQKAGNGLTIKEISIKTLAEPPQN